MKLILFALFCTFVVACAPKNRPLKGSRKTQSENEKIKESAYNGNGLDVASFATMRLVEIKRVFDLAKKWPTVNARAQKQNANTNLVDICGKRPKGVYREFLYKKYNKVGFKLRSVDCSHKSSHTLSAKISGTEYIEITYVSPDDQPLTLEHRVIESIEYSAKNLRQKLKASKKHLLTASSHVQLNEWRSLVIYRQSQGTYSFDYSVDGRFKQRMLTASFETNETSGYQYLEANGLLNIENNKMQMKNVQMYFLHDSPRKVVLKYNHRHLFTNDKNKLELTLEIPSRLSFGEKCGYLSGELDIVSYENYNNRRNRFHLKLDSITNRKVEINENSFNLLESPEAMIKLENIKCLTKKRTLPIAPYELIFLH